MLTMIKGRFRTLKARLLVAIILVGGALSAFTVFDTSSKCPGEEGYYFTNYRKRNPQRGGFVSNTAYVDEGNDNLFIGPEACVCGNAIVEGGAKISGNVIVRGNAHIDGSDVFLTGDLVIEGNTKIKSNTRLYGKGNIRSGVYENTNKELAESASSTTSLSKHELFRKMKDLVSRNSYLYPDVENLYTDGDLLEQSIDYKDSECSLVIRKKRKDTKGCARGKASNSVFYVSSVVTINLRDVYSLLLRNYSSSLATVSLQVENHESKVSKKYAYQGEDCSFSDWRSGWQIKTYMVYNSSSAESVEFKSLPEAEEFKKLLQQLLDNCK